MPGQIYCPDLQLPNLQYCLLLFKAMAYADEDGYEHMCLLGEDGNSASDILVRWITGWKGEPHLCQSPKDLDHVG